MLRVPRSAEPWPAGHRLAAVTATDPAGSTVHVVLRRERNQGSGPGAALLPHRPGPPAAAGDGTHAGRGPHRRRWSPARHLVGPAGVPGRGLRVQRPGPGVGGYRPAHRGRGGAGTVGQRTERPRLPARPHRRARAGPGGAGGRHPGGTRPAVRGRGGAAARPGAGPAGRPPGPVRRRPRGRPGGAAVPGRSRGHRGRPRLAGAGVAIRAGPGVTGRPALAGRARPARGGGGRRGRGRDHRAHLVRQPGCRPMRPR